MRIRGDRAPPAAGQRYVRYGVAALCAALIAFAALRSTTLVSAARSQRLSVAEQAIAAATRAHIEQDRVPNALNRSVESLLDEPSLALNYVTLRNADHMTLLSRGRFGDRFAWLGAATARQWRGWDYRIESAEARRPLMRDGRRIASVEFGVHWAGVFTSAGLALAAWLIALLGGLIGLLGALAGRGERANAGAPATGARATTGLKPAPAPASKPRRLGRRAGGDEFTPIADAVSDRPPRAKETASAALTPARRAAPQGDASPTPGKDQPARPASRPKPRSDAQPAATPSTPAAASAEPDRGAAGTRRSRPPEAKAPSTEPNPAAAESAVPAPDPTPRVAIEPAPAYAELHAPRVDAQPQLGDDTLDLRFYPIWRDCARESLAGACAALAWRTGESRLVDADTLTRLAERDGALRAFTQWIARRFSLLHSNWRTLELATVPIVLPIPSAMLGFADAETVWRDALRRTDRDPNDLILRLGGRVRRNAHHSLPVRRALTLAGHDTPTPPDCDVACIQADGIGPDVEAWYARIEQLSCPVLIGPIAEPQRYARLINHARVLWYSDADEAIHSPRAFARLLARQPSQPM